MDPAEVAARLAVWSRAVERSRDWDHQVLTD
jgi:hypothetical protein